MATENISYAGSWTDYTITLASLASDSNLLAGRESTAVSNTTNLFIDYHIGGLITTGTSPTDERNIEVWVYANVGGATTYLDVLDGTDSNETITSEDIKHAMLQLAAVLPTDSTSDRTYNFGPLSLVSLFGHVPENHGLFVVHDTGVNLNSTGSNHKLSYRGIERDIA